MKSIVTFFVIALGLFVTAAVCQELAPTRQSYQNSTITAGNQNVPSPLAIAPGVNQLPAGLGGAQKAATHNAYLKLKAAEDDEAKAQAKTELREALTEEYDASLDAYAEHLEQLEQKIAELKDQLRRRRSAKSEMVELKFQMLVHEADGLGWPDQAPGLKANLFFSPFAVPAPVPGKLAPPTRPKTGAR